MNILNDTEHRIFLSAMAREKEICQKIDGDKIYDSTVKMLVPVCESIERKVDIAILIPDGATNGEVLKALFEERIYNALKDRMQYTKWWNAPYTGGEDN